MNQNRLIIIIGAYGSGKSEYSINIAKKIRNTVAGDVCLIDLDVVNPYFRSRDVIDLLAKENIDVIAPDKKFGNADLPMISPRVKGAIKDLNRTVILDVGGDPAGSKALGRFEDDIKEREYEMIFVVNTKRPFTSNYEDIVEMKEMLENISKLKVSEIICNANLIEQTNIDLITDGIAIIKEVAEKQNLKFNNYLVMEDKNNIYPDEINGIKKINLEYFLAKPWETGVKSNAFC